MLWNWPMFHGGILISPSRFPWIYPWISQRGVVEKVVKDERTPRALPSANAWGALKRKKEKNIDRPGNFCGFHVFFWGGYLFFGAFLEYHFLEVSNMLILGFVSGNVTNSLWRGIFFGNDFFLGIICFLASVCAFAFAFAAFAFAFAAFASRAFVTSALLSAHLLLSCFRVVFCLSFCRTSKCNACVCTACSRSSQPTYALRLVWMHSGSQVGSLRAHVQLHAGMWGYQPVSNTTTETKRQTAHPCEATSPTSPPKSRSASRWTSHTASPSISPNYARSSQANTGTARAAQSSARSRMWSVCSYHDRSGCDPSNAGDPWAPGLYCDCQNAAQWSVRFVALGYRSSSITLGKKNSMIFTVLGLQRWRSGECLITAQPGNAGFVACLKIFNPKQKQSWRGLSVISEACEWEYTVMPCIRTSSSGNAQGCA